MYGLPEITKQQVIQELGSNNKWVEQALLLLYRYQTEDEKEGGETVEQNGKGFNYNDAPTLSYYATELLKGNSLSSTQYLYAKMLLPKYCGQILAYIKANPNHPFTT